MSFLSTLGKIGGIAGAVAGLPFTGGLSLAAIPSIIGAAGGVASAIGKGRSADRAQTNQANQIDYLNRQKQYQQENDRAVANYNAVPGLYSRAMMGDIVSGMQPVHWDETGKLVGGITPDLFSQATRDAGRNMSADALSRMLSNNPLGLSTVPSLPTTAAPTGFDKAMNILGVAGGITDALRKTKGPTQPSLSGQQPEATGRTETGVLDTGYHAPAGGEGGWAPGTAAWTPPPAAPNTVTPADVAAMSGAIPWRRRNSRAGSDDDYY